MEMPKSLRTALFVPGNRPDRVDKAVRAGADAVIIDLEDAVPPAQKEETRSLVREKVMEHKKQPIIVRVNGLETPFIRRDLEEIWVESLSCIMIPKVESAEDMEEINRLLLAIEKNMGPGSKGMPVMVLIESARGVEQVFQITTQKTVPKRLITVAFGAADYTVDMGIEMTASGEELLYPRSRIAVACRAGDVDPPLDSPFMLDLKDLEALEQDAQRARRLGFQGKLCIHPNQVDICNRVFAPTEKEIEDAKRVLDAFQKAEKQGQGAVQLDGKFIDYPIVKRAKRILRAVEGKPSE
jgi:citrate lyase subunit beta/citryl-CoA lyase